MTNTPFHQANAALRTYMETMRDEIVGSLNAIATTVENTEPQPVSVIPSVNTASASNQSFLDALQSIQTEFTQA